MARRCFVRNVSLLLPVLLVGLSGSQAAAQSTHESIQGVWQAVQVTLPGPSPQTINIVEPRPNLTIITAKHYSRVQDESAEPRPIPIDIAKASADELRAAWGPFVGEAGRYEIGVGNVLTMRPIVAKNPAAMKSGAFTTWSFKIEGNTLLVTARTNQNGPVDPVIIKAIRVE